MCSGARNAFSAAEDVDVLLLARKEAGVRLAGANPNTDDIRHVASKERSDNLMAYPVRDDKRAQKAEARTVMANQGRSFEMARLSTGSV
jgi:hypothetical protein